MVAELQLIDDWYEFTRTVAERIAKFPRTLRLTVGAEIVRRCTELLGELVRAKYTPHGPWKGDILRHVNVEIEILRFHLRLAHDLKALPHDAHRHALERLRECGRQLGGWIKAVAGKGGS